MVHRDGAVKIPRAKKPKPGPVKTPQVSDFAMIAARAIATELGGDDSCLKLVNETTVIVENS